MEEQSDASLATHSRALSHPLQLGLLSQTLTLKQEARGNGVSKAVPSYPWSPVPCPSPLQWLAEAFHYPSQPAQSYFCPCEALAVQRQAIKHLQSLPEEGQEQPCKGLYRNPQVQGRESSSSQWQVARGCSHYRRRDRGC